MRKLPTRSQMMSTEDEPADGSQGDQHKNKPSTNKPLDPKSKKLGKSANSSSSKDMSPARQIMKAVTSLALNPKKKKVPKKTASKGENQDSGTTPKKGIKKATAPTKDSDGDFDND